MHANSFILHLCSEEFNLTSTRQPCDYEIIGKIKALLKIPVILNGASMDVK